MNYLQKKVTSILNVFFAPFSKEVPLTHIKKILIITNGRLGDSLLSLPLIHSIRNAHPHAKISLLVDPLFKELWKYQPYHDDLLFYKAPWMSYEKTPRPFASWVALLKKIRKQSYDVIIDTRGDFRNMLLIGFLSKARIRISHTYSGKGLLTSSIPYTPRHEVENGLAIASKLGGVKTPYTFHVGKKEQKKADALLKDIPSPRIIIFPTPGYESKEWDNKKWAAIADAIEGEVLFAGAKGDTNPSTIMKHMKTKATDFTGVLTLNELAGVLKRTVLAIGVDTGPMHLAAATGVKTVTLFGPTDPVRWRPYGKGDIIKKERVADITIQDVLEKIHENTLS